ncbi:non-canonical purine NTP pyrophosphatase [Clostridium sp. C8-1-8]|uniref:non-canonical purine NTP pyrophosphatase n=1 Tax=Clostridium sp. C8-1-8 TaxID=2698831 RepID=UPI00136AB96B|nr:non-canonical purine NTP pyrophosphatase [Clostridium sp. C8-1-8]
MDNSLIYVTGNSVKFEVALNAFINTGINIIQMKLDTPEIQSKSVQEVAMYSARWASRQINKSVIVTDAGFYIEALKGFPGPFIKYVNEWFSADDFINLVKDKDNRSIIIQDCLAYCHPDSEPIVFTGTYNGTLATQPSLNEGTSIEKVFIPEGFYVPISDIPPEEMISYWSNGEIMSKFKNYIIENPII